MTRSAFLVATPHSGALRALNYAPELEVFAHAKKGSFRPAPLRELLSGLGESYWAVFTRLDCSREHGVELLSQTDMFAAEPEGRVIRRDSMPSPEEHLVKRWQILIAGAGQMGDGNLFARSIIADGRVAGGYLGPHAAALTFADPGGDLNLWTYAFLNTSIGMRAVRACAFGTSVPGLRLDLLSAVPIPIPVDGSWLAKVGSLLRRCVQLREEYLRDLRLARAIVEELPVMRRAHEMCADRRARCVLWTGSLRTLCAWNAASTGDALGLLQREWSGRLGDLVGRDGIFYGPRFARTPCEPPHGLEFMSQRDMFLIRPAPRRIAHPGFADHKLFVPEDTLMVGAQGTLGEGEIFGKSLLIRGRLAKMAYTQHLLRIVCREGFAPSLFAFLSTIVGQRLLRSTAVGTKLLSMREDLLRDLPVPELTSEQIKTVESYIVRAFDAREGADRAEIDAINLVEGALETWLA